MLDSTPGPLQALLWPLLGAAVILLLSRLLPNWLQRLVACVASAASFAVLWSLRSQPEGRIDFLWDPLTLFRMGPRLSVDPLALMVGITLSGLTAVTVLGIRGGRGRGTAWHGWMLVALSACLAMAMASNILTLALGSGLLDLVLLAMAVSAVGGEGGGQRAAWRMAVPGLASTVVLVLCALKMDSEVGTASLMARQVPSQVLMLLGVSGLLRLMVVPLQVRGLCAPELAASWLLPAGVGVYLLARVESLAQVLAALPWFLPLVAASLLVGGWLAWLSGARTQDPSVAEAWSGFATHQAGLAAAYVALFRSQIPWPLISLGLALAGLAIWWDGRLGEQSMAQPRRLPSSAIAGMTWLKRRTEAGWNALRTRIEGRFSIVEHWHPRGLARRAAPSLSAILLASLAGMPATVGALARWNLYAMLLHDGRSGLLMVAMLADTLVAGGLWTTLREVRGRRQETGRKRLGARGGIHNAEGDTQDTKHKTQAPVVSLLAVATLALAVIVLGVAPGRLIKALALTMAAPGGVSGWGVGLLLVLPWLLGGWLTRVAGRARPLLQQFCRQSAEEDLLYGAVRWVGARLANAIYWLGRVGEGEGWWGWALVVLAIGTLFLVSR